MTLPSIDNLRCFVAGAEQLNFRQAARRVALTPAAFGQRVRQLEDQLGERLFERTSRRVALTPAGHALLPAARAALVAAARCVDAVHPEASRTARLTLGTRFELGMSWIVPWVSELATRRPAWRIELYFGSGPDLLAQLRAGVVDAIVTSAPVARSEWHQEVLHPEDYVFCAAPSLLERAPFRSADDASEHTLLDIDHAQPLSRYLVSVAPPMTFADVLACGTAGAVCAFARAGLGVAVAPRYMVEADLAAGRLVPLLPDVTLLRDAFRMLWRRGSPDADVLAALADELRARPL